MRTAGSERASCCAGEHRYEETKELARPSLTRRVLEDARQTQHSRRASPDQFTRLTVSHRRPPASATQPISLLYTEKRGGSRIVCYTYLCPTNGYICLLTRTANQTASTATCYIEKSSFSTSTSPLHHRSTAHIARSNPAPISLLARRTMYTQNSVLDLVRMTLVDGAANAS